jgi:hypothetical protein
MEITMKLRSTTPLLRWPFYDSGRLLLVTCKENQPGKNRQKGRCPVMPARSKIFVTGCNDVLRLDVDAAASKALSGAHDCSRPWWISPGWLVGWWVGTMEFYDFPNGVGMMIQSDELTNSIIFQRGRSSTNQTPSRFRMISLLTMHFPRTEVGEIPWPGLGYSWLVGPWSLCRRESHSNMPCFEVAACFLHVSHSRQRAVNHDLL